MDCYYELIESWQRCLECVSEIWFIKIHGGQLCCPWIFLKWNSARGLEISNSSDRRAIMFCLFCCRPSPCELQDPLWVKMSAITGSITKKRKKSDAKLQSQMWVDSGRPCLNFTESRIIPFSGAILSVHTRDPSHPFSSGFSIVLEYFVHSLTIRACLMIFLEGIFLGWALQCPLMKLVESVSELCYFNINNFFDLVSVNPGCLEIFPLIQREFHFWGLREVCQA